MYIFALPAKCAHIGYRGLVMAITIHIHNPSPKTNYFKQFYWTNRFRTSVTLLGIGLWIDIAITIYNWRALGQIYFLTKTAMGKLAKWKEMAKGFQFCCCYSHDGQAVTPKGYSQSGYATYRAHIILLKSCKLCLLLELCKETRFFLFKSPELIISYDYG